MKMRAMLRPSPLRTSIGAVFILVTSWRLTISRHVPGVAESRIDSDRWEWGGPEPKSSRRACRGATVPGILPVSAAQQREASDQHSLPDDLALPHQCQRLCCLLEREAMGDVRRDAPGGEPSHEDREILALPGRIETAQGADREPDRFRVL